MKHIVWKPYWDYEKEERWLNEMSLKGLAMTAYSWCRYVFTEAERGEYTYRIELLENLPSHPESRAYIRFLEENGVEYVASYMRWIYLRKKTADGPFDIYSDLDSKITHYKRINRLWLTLMLAEAAIAFSNLSIGISNFSMEREGFGSANLILGSLLAVFALLFFFLGVPIRRKIKKLKQEKRIRE